MEIRRVEEEERKKEGRIGEWERVSVVKPKVVPARVEGEGEERKPELAGDGQEDKEKEEDKEEEDRPTQRRWLKEKTAVSTEDEWDPTKVAPLKLKRKILTLREEEALREEEERVKRAKKDAEKERRRREKAVVTKAGWQEVEVTEEPLLEFDEPEVEQTEDGEGEAGDEVKPKVEEDVKPVSGFKKRKMFGAGAAKRR